MDYALDAPRRGYSIFNHEFFDSKEVLIFRNFALVPFTRLISIPPISPSTRLEFVAFLRYLSFYRSRDVLAQSLNKRNKKNEIKTS